MDLFPGIGKWTLSLSSQISNILSPFATTVCPTYETCKKIDYKSADSCVMVPLDPPVYLISVEILKYCWNK